MVASLAISAGKAKGQINVWQTNPGCAPNGSHPVSNGCGDSELAPPGLIALESGSSWINANILPDRRPIAFIKFSESSDVAAWGLGGNPEGLRSWWRLPALRAGGNPDNPNDFVADEPYDGDGDGVPDQCNAVINSIRNLYVKGFRRFVLFMPGGSHCGRRFAQRAANDPNQIVGYYYAGQDIATNQWLAMPQWKRDFFSDPNGDFQRYKARYSDASFELYMGSALMNDACTLNMHPASETYPVSTGGGGVPAVPQLVDVPVSVESTFPYDTTSDRRWVVPNFQSVAQRSIDPRDPTHMKRFWSIIEPWAECGVLGIWLDAGAYSVCPSGSDEARRKYGLHEIAYNPFLRNHGVRIGGEAFPVTDNDGIVLDQVAIRQVPYMALDSWLLQTGTSINASWPNNVRWDNFGPIPHQSSGVHRSELHAIISNNDISTPEVLGEMRKRGYILSPMSANEPWKEFKVAQVQRWYSMGEIDVVDFDGDGTVSASDYTEFYLAWNANRDRPGFTRAVTVFATADLNEDHVVDEADRDLWEQWWAAYSQTGARPKIPFSGPYDQ